MSGNVEQEAIDQGNGPTEQVFAGIMFEAAGSAKLQVIMNNVTPEQVLLAGTHLSEVARRMLNDQWTRNQIREAQEQQQMLALLNKDLGRHG